LKILCSHAHSADPEMRISALWALKHLVLSATDKVKEQAFEELGSGFIMQLLTGDSAKNHLAAPNALGEKVDLLNDEPAMDIDDSSSDDDSLYGGEMRDSAKGRYGPAEDYAGRLRPLKNSEENPSFKARRDAIRIQHHALDFLRNVLCEPSASHSAVVNQILSNIGVTRFFDVVMSKIRQRPRPGLHATSTAGKRPTLTTPGATEARVEFLDPNAYAHPDIVLAALYILVHFANGNPPHRQMVIQQPNLVNAVVPLFSHPNEKIRVGCCWLVHNLLWVEDGSDKKGARQRALDLRSAGVEDEVRKAVRDETLDVRERAKATLDSFARLLDVPGSAETSRERTRERPWERIGMDRSA
jgi:armadillo repeat-containing protein 8